MKKSIHIPERNLFYYIVFGLLMGANMVGCAPTLAERQSTASGAIALLQQSKFEDAAAAADGILQTDAENPFAAFVKAISLYKSTMHQFVADGRTLVVGAAMTRHLNYDYFDMMMDKTQRQLSEVEQLLTIAANEPNISLNLCVACLEVDWNQNGELDSMDTHLFEIEYDAQEQSIPSGDPRRRPEFRLDHGDVIWAQAFVSFHLAALELLQAYDLSQIPFDLHGDEIITLKLRYPEKIPQAQALIQQGLAYSLAARAAYLTETDDDREWLPNPSQRNHPMPLEITPEFYETWQLVVEDLQKLVSGETSLDVTELAQLGDHQWEQPPRGYINIGKLFSNAKDITVNLEQLEDDMDRLEDADTAAEVEHALRDILGFVYVRNAKPTSLLSRMERMKNEVERGEESIRRKLQYLFWVN